MPTKPKMATISRVGTASSAEREIARLRSQLVQSEYRRVELERHGGEMIAARLAFYQLINQRILELHGIMVLINGLVIAGRGEMRRAALGMEGAPSMDLIGALKGKFDQTMGEILSYKENTEVAFDAARTLNEVIAPLVHDYQLGLLALKRDNDDSKLLKLAEDAPLQRMAIAWTESLNRGGAPVDPANETIRAAAATLNWQNYVQSNQVIWPKLWYDITELLVRENTDKSRAALEKMGDKKNYAAQRQLLRNVLGNKLEKIGGGIPQIGG